MAATQETKNLVPKMSHQEAMERLQCGQSVLVLDVRQAGDWKKAEGKIQGALRMDPGDCRLDPTWPRDRFTLVYCSCKDEETSSRIARQLKDQGLTDVNVLRGGFDAWQAGAGPVEPKSVDQSDPRT